MMNPRFNRDDLPARAGRHFGRHAEVYVFLSGTILGTLLTMLGVLLGRL
jgi:hypothetical protein